MQPPPAPGRPTALPGPFPPPTRPAQPHSTHSSSSRALHPTKPSSRRHPAPNDDFLQDDPSSDRQNLPFWSELECRVLTTAFVPRLLEERARQEGGKGDLIIEPHCDFAHIAGCCNQVTSVARFPPSSSSFFFPLSLFPLGGLKRSMSSVLQSCSSVGPHGTWTPNPNPLLPPRFPQLRVKRRSPFSLSWGWRRKTIL